MSQSLSTAPCGTACGSVSLVKNGHNSRGSEQFFCKACGARRVLKPKTRPATPERKAQGLRAVAGERLSLRAAGRVFGVARQTIARWIGKKPRRSRR